MSLLNPALLIGLAALAIPIIVHFLNRRRFRKVPWAAMRFLRVSVEKNKRRMQVEDWILLATRLLLIALIVFALARPALEKLGIPSLSGGIASAVIVDTSGSMARTDRGSAGTRFDAARAAAREVIDALPAGSSASLTFAADTAPPISPSGDLTRLGATLDKATPSDRASDLAPAIADAIASLGNRTASARELVLVTDGAAGAFRDFETIARALETADESIRTVIAMVGGEPGENLSLTRLEQSSPVAAAGAPLRLSVQVENTGATEAPDVQVALEIDSQPAGEPILLGSIPAGESRSATVFTELPGAGFHQITAALPGGDASPADDSRTLVVNAVTQERALLVDGSPGRGASDSATFFLRNALVPVPPEAAASFYLAADTIPASALSTTDLSAYRAVFLADVTEFPEDIADRVASYVRDGGGLVVFAGDSLERTFYNNTLHTKLGLLPATFDEATEGESKLASSGFGHPLVSLWESAPGAGLAGISVRKAMPLRLPENSPAAVVFRFGDGSPALVESQFGRGSVYQCGLSADTSWSDLPVRPAFLPLVQQLFGRVLTARDAGLNLSVGETFVRSGPPSWTGKSATVYATGDATSKGQLVPIAATEGGARLEFASTGRAGAYEFTLADPPVSLPFAANPDPGESDATPLTAAQLDRLRRVAEIVPLASGANLSEALGRERGGAELWPLLILAAAILAALELFLAQRFSRER